MVVGTTQFREVNVSKDLSGRILVSFPYAPLWVEKIKAIPGHRWHFLSSLVIPAKAGIQKKRIVVNFNNNKPKKGDR